MMKYCQRDASLGLALFVACTLLLVGRTQAMTNDEQQLALESVEQQSATAEANESPAIGIIAPRNMNLKKHAEAAGDIQTIVKQLKAAGVVTAEKQELETLSYRQLSRLLGIWHLTQNRNYYVANQDDKLEPPRPTLVAPQPET